MTKEELIKAKTISAISLGCDKNRVDLEHMLFSVRQYGFVVTPTLEDAQIIIVNTCAFLQEAIVEAVENIEYALSMKEKGACEKVIVSGCLPMREMASVVKQFPQVDAFLTLKDNQNITSVIENLYDLQPSNFKPKHTGRVITNQSNYAYLKIAEGCSNGCAYCTIPRIRGRFISIPEKEILEEANSMVKSGYSELILVAQDTARYGEDLYGKPRLIQLLKNLAKIKNLKWIRLQYIYPEWVTDELLEYIQKEPKMCKYLDMPMQHIDDEILHDMNRRNGEEDLRNIVEKLKTKYPEIVLRTTFIVGFPGETKEKFNKLCKFVEESEIPYASFFAYSKEEKTKAYYLPHQVYNWVKNRRLKKIFAIQNVVMNKINQAKIGEVQEVMIDQFDCEQNIYIGHSKNSSPEVDLKVVVDANFEKQLQVGQIYDIKITDIHNLGLKGEIL